MELKQKWNPQVYMATRRYFGIDSYTYIHDLSYSPIQGSISKIFFELVAFVAI